MEKRYLVVAPVLKGKYLEDEIISPEQVGPELAKYIARGAVRAVGSEEIGPIEANYRSFILPAPTTPDDFASWSFSVTGTKTICAPFFDTLTQKHEFSYLGGTFMVGRTSQVVTQHPNGYGYLAPYCGTWGLSNEAISELNKQSEPNKYEYENLSFRVIPLETRHLKVQLRCSIPILAEYVRELVAQLYLRWPDSVEGSEPKDQAKMPDAATEQNSAGAYVLPENVWAFVEHNVLNHPLNELTDNYLKIRKHYGRASNAVGEEYAADELLELMKKGIQRVNPKGLRRQDLIKES